MKKLSLLAVITTLIAISIQPAQVQAQGTTIGFVDPHVILERMPEMRAVQQRLQNFYERRISEIETKESELQTAVQQYEQRSGVISDAAREREEERLGQLDMELRQSQGQLEQEFEERRAELMSPLIEQIEEAISSVATSRSIDLILNTRTSTGDVIILYVTEEMQQQNDITDAVMQNLGI
ncbi:MAG: OmpH family outer membrane protein [Balneolaceae bacterium]